MEANESFSGMCLRCRRFFEVGYSGLCPQCFAMGWGPAPAKTSKPEAGAPKGDPGKTPKAGRTSRPEMDPKTGAKPLGSQKRGPGSEKKRTGRGR